MKRPTPRMPLACSAWGVSRSGRPLLVQAPGGAAKLGLAMSWMGTASACSSASPTSAVTTGPHTAASTNAKHSPSGALPLGTGGSARLTCDATMRTPEEPVSTRISGMVWQVVVPGTQSVTLVSSVLIKAAANAVFTVMGWVLGPVMGAEGLPPLGEEAPLEEEPPPQPGSRRSPTASMRAHQRPPSPAPVLWGAFTGSPPA